MLNYGDLFYIINGESNNAINQSECYYSKLTGGGDYSAWVETANTENNSWFHGVAIVDGTTDTFLYRVAGNYRGTTEQGMYRSTINTDGSLTPWVRDPTDTPQARYEHACTVVNNQYIFMVGGLFGADPQNTVFYTTIDPDTGAVSGWRTGNPYPETVSRLAAVSYEAGGRDYLLVVSGGPYLQTGLRNPNCWYTEVGVDTDGDTVPDYRDNCPYLFNSGQADADDDGYGDACDVCDNSPPGHQLASDGSLRADFEPDCDVDLADFAEFQVCFDPTATATEECAESFDLNDDTKVNLDDLAEFEAALAGP
jgi:hypothetical protein